ncbi:MAG: DNA topoisomerase IV subunit A [Erysipelothrix sp.]|nr:DNA topoisomerase IV subunit A [Erysipelothrix sp.]
MSSDYIKVPLEDLVGDRFGRYSKYIIQERALPDVRDGLKPVQRRILYAMYHERNLYDKPYRKSAKTVGLVIGNYHPHGDSSVYEAMVRLSQSWKMNMPLVDMQGNNGSIDDDPAAAMRYTEARLSKIAHYLLENIEEDTVPFVLNFDDMTTEPSILPTRFPNLLVNGATGIASGYATKIPPFNLGEVLNAVIYRMQNENCTFEEISQFIKGPDFPTGAIIQGKEGIMNILETGKGRIVLRAKSEIVEKKNLIQIVITELPYEVIKSNVVRKIDELRFAKQDEGLGDVMDVRDESDRNGLRIVIDCKKGANAESILNLFLKETELQVYYNANMVSIIDQRPKLTGVLEIIDAYIAFRKEVVLNRSQYRFNKKEARLHIIEGLIKAVSILDEIIAIIRKSKNRGDSRDNLMEAFDFSFEQASAIVDLQLYRLSSTDIVSLREEFAKLANELEELNLILNDENMLKMVLIQEFNEVKEIFDTPRRSVIEDEISELEIDRLSLIQNESVMLTLTQEGYLKRVSLRSYNSSQQNMVALNEGDHPIFVGQVQTLDQIVFITSKGRYGHLLVHEIEEARWRDIGSHLNEYVKLDPSEEIINAFMVDDFDTHMYLSMVTRNGMVKRSLVKDLEVVRNNRLYDVINLEKDDTLVGAYLSFDDSHILMGSHESQFMRLDLKDINPQGLRAKGVIGMKLKAGDYITAVNVIDHESDIFILSDRYHFKRIKNDDVPVNNRSTMGVLAARKVKSNPHHIKFIGVGNINDAITYYTDALNIFELKEIPLMNFSSTYSQVLKVEPFFIIDKVKYTQKVSFPVAASKNDPEPLKLDI